MLLCYVDESGDEQVLASREAPPVLVLAGLVVPEAGLKRLIRDFLDLKKRFAGRAIGKNAQLSQVIAYEIKGANLRSTLRKGTRRGTRLTIGFLDNVITLLERHCVGLVGYVDVKADNRGPGANIYPMAIARLAEQFEAKLSSVDEPGVMILDARTKVKNVPSVHGITTRKFKASGDELPHLSESPVFGHSDSHVVLQIADIVASALLFPMACAAYCEDVTNNVHPHEAYPQLRERYGERLRRLEHRYSDKNGRRCGGIIVFDNRNRKPSRLLFNDLVRPKLTTVVVMPDETARVAPQRPASA